LIFGKLEIKIDFKLIPLGPLETGFDDENYKLTLNFKIILKNHFY